MNRFLLAIALVLTAGTARADGLPEGNALADGFQSGRFLKTCEIEPAVCTTFVHGQLTGISVYIETLRPLLRQRELSADTEGSLRLAEKIVMGCRPAKLTIYETSRIWLKFLAARPETHGLPPAYTLLQALQESFPCD